MQTALSFILSHFFVRGKEQVRWRDSKGRFVKRDTMTRVTLGCKGIDVRGIPVLHNYKSFTLTFWTTGKIDKAYLTERLIIKMEHYLGYEQALWWFTYAIGYGEQEVEYDESLEGKTEFEIR